MIKQTHRRFVNIIKIVCVMVLISAIVSFISFGLAPRPLPFLQSPVIFWKTYKNMEYKYEIIYPRSFVPKDIENDAYLDFVSFTKDDDLYYVYVTDSRLNEEVERVISQVEGHVVVNKTVDEPTTLLGYPARIIGYSTSSIDGNKDTISVIVDNGQYTYAINSSSELSRWIISSFRLMN